MRGKQAAIALLGKTGINQQNSAAVRLRANHPSGSLHHLVHAGKAVCKGKSVPPLLFIVLPQQFLTAVHLRKTDPHNNGCLLYTSIISDRGLTALMITHDMDQALRFGNRTIMMDSGKLLLDISGEERDAMTPEKLVDLFVRSAKQTLSDRTRLSI